MKRFLLMLAFTALVIPAYMQDIDSSTFAGTENPDELSDSTSPQKVVIVSTDTKKDTVRLKIGKKGIAIIDDGTETIVKVTEIDDDKNPDKKSFEEIKVDKEAKNQEEKASPPRMKGHWAGFAFGLNNFVDKNFSMSRTDENRFMDLNTGKSWNYNLNLFEQSFGLYSDKIGLVTGLGFSFNNYHFDGNNSITKDSVENTVSLDYGARGIHLEKTKLATTYLNLPILLEFQFPGPPKKRLYFSVGIVGGLKVGSHTKVIYKLDGKQKDKIRDDFNLSPLRYAYTARVGYRNLQVYGNYYATPLFEKNRGPKLFPIDVGLCLSF